MASVVLTVVGTAIGGPIGGLVGGLIGQRVDQAIFGGKNSRTIEGGRIKDLTVQTSAYGEPISRIYGTMRVPGNVIWSSGLKEVRNEKTESSGGKGRRQNVTTVEYSYSASFAVALSGRVISDVGRVWADGKLLRDAAGKVVVGGEMRVYRGGGFQQSDPMIEAVEGQGNVNGFANLSYVVFEDLALGEYANRIPNLTFEVIADTGGEILLSVIVSDICQLSNITVFDASDLDQIVGGYLVSGPMKSRAAIEELARVYQFDVVEQENGLLFRKLGRLSEAAILADDLVQSAQGARPSDKVTITRQQDMELPREVGLSYIDPSRDYQTGHQRARRLNVASDIVRQSGLPLVLSSSQAKTVSEIQLDLAWYGRETISFALPHKYGDLLPGDIVTMASNPEAQDYLLQETEIGPEGVQCQAVKFSNIRLDRAAQADSGPVPVQQVAELAESLFFHFDMPTITGENVTSPVFFWAAAAGAGKWPGAGLFISRDNDQTYSQLDYTNADAISGIVENILPDGPAAYWDYGNEILVRLDNPDHGLSGAALEAVLDGANIAWVGGEIIQFQQATFELGGFYRLTGLLRGRRGTERYISQHSISETFILLNRATVNTAVMYHSDIGLIHHFKVVTAGADVEDAPSVSRAYGAAVLKPFSPVHGKGLRDGAGTLALTWIRRSRVGGDWMDNADVPLGENYERYDIEILNDGAVVRSLTSDVSEVIYPASSQIEDFGAVQAILDIRIFQISDNIGRGWPLVLSV
ncbi:Gene Transfer Agent host specificity protein [hydrothermal vent metagenome]|uniref:Gene Transfer Agent host specificity protein n=1 Tax=hydrothermal vent metagenome TaxID=652676 RepID=A0A3B1B5U9_9ZZZZ